MEKCIAFKKEISQRSQQRASNHTNEKQSELTLDKEFDTGEDITEFLDFLKARRPGQEQKRVNVDLQVWMIHSLDKEAKRLGAPRQSIIKIWIAESIERGF